MQPGERLIQHLLAAGRHHFTTPDAIAFLADSPVNVRAILRRLTTKGTIATPFRSFHVIVPPEYRRIGCLPPEQFVPQLMAQRGLAYHVGLLSAAELHGAAPERPQAFQVIVAAPLRDLECGSVSVQFVQWNHVAAAPAIDVGTPRGPMRVATAATTALELAGMAAHSGGLGHVTSVLAELSEVVAPDALAAAAPACPIAWAQRLGYLLDEVGRSGLANALQPEIERRAHAFAPLVRAASRTGAVRVSRWRLLINAAVEMER